MSQNLIFLLKASIIDSRKTIAYWHSAANCYMYLDFNPNTLLKGILDEQFEFKHPTVHAGLALCEWQSSSWFATSMLIGNTNICYCSHSVDWTDLTALLAIVDFMILTQILIYTIYNTLYGSNVAVISTFSLRIETAAIVFKPTCW